MARRKRTSSASSAGSFAWRRWLVSRLPAKETRAALRQGLASFLVVAAVALVVSGSLHIKDTVEGSERFRLESWRREFSEFPSWITPEIEREIAGVPFVDEEGELDLFEDGALARLESILAASPWVLSVREIELSYPTSSAPGAIRASLEVRPPVAIVKAGGLYYLTGEDAMRLGEPYAEAPRSWFGVPVITGVREPVGVPEPGERWTAQDVIEGVSVARLLFREGIHRDYPDRPIEAIDVSNAAGRLDPRESEIVLVSGRRALEWGRSPRSPRSRTLGPAKLVDNLRYVLEHMDGRDDRRVKLYTSRPVASLQGAFAKPPRRRGEATAASP